MGSQESGISSLSAVKATVSTQVQSTSSSKSSVSTSSTSESNYNINNRLDELASNLDPWAHIQHAQHKENLEKEASPSPSTTTTTTTPTTTTTTAEETTKLSLFTIKTTDTTTTISTTTFKAKSLKELLIHRNGGVTSEFPTEEENTIPPILETTTTAKTTTRKPYTPRKTAAASLRGKFRPKRPQKEDVRTPKEDKAHLIEGKDVPETNRISTSFTDRHKLKELPIKKDDASKLLPEDYKPSQRTTANFESDALLRELLNDLREKDLDKLIPNRKKFGSSSPTRNFATESSTNRGSTKSGRISDTVTVEDVSKFLPPGYEQSTTPEPYKLEINNLFKNVEIQPVELPAGLLPKGYKPEPKYSSKNSLPPTLSPLLPATLSPATTTPTTTLLCPMVSMAQNMLPRTVQSSMLSSVRPKLTPL